MPTLEWIRKDKVINHHLDVPYRVLEKQYTYGEDSGNMIIYGDNLSALKSLLPQYEGQIKCIYIDPPYNTAKSSEKNKAWVYSDNVDDPHIKKWLNSVVGDEDKDFSRHDKWLCMMYPRLKLLYRLLADDGIIFISIDDNECHNLRFICDEIFGHKNYIAQLVWRSDGNFDNQAKIKNCHEYIFCYGKKEDSLGLPNGIDPNVTGDSKIYKDEIRNTVVKNGPKNPMSKLVLPIGFPCAVKSMTIPKRFDAFPYYYEDAIIKDYKLQNEVTVETGWASKNIMMSFIENGFNPVIDTKGQMTTFEITKTGAIELVKKREKISHVLSILSNLGSTQNMSNILSQMNISFNFPKPTQLIEYIIGFYADKDSIILDSFAGSGTTAHAVLNLNKADGGNRKFILIEMMDYAEELTAERVKRVIEGYSTSSDKEEIIYEAELTVSNLKKAEIYLDEAKQARKSALENAEYKKVSKVKLADNKITVTGTVESAEETNGTGGGFSFYELGDTIFDGEYLNENIGTQKIREYVYFTETKQPVENIPEQPYLLGNFLGTAYYFYYEKNEVTTLGRKFWSTIKIKAENYVIYADKCILSDEKLENYHITFKKIPRDITRL